MLHKLGLPREDAKRARTCPLAGKDLFGNDTIDFVTFLNDQAKEAQVGVGGKFLHGPTAFVPKVLQNPHAKGAASGFTIPKLKQPFRAAGPGNKPNQAPALPPTVSGPGKPKRGVKSRKSSKGKPAAAGKPSG